MLCTLCHARVPYAPETCAHCSYSIANILHSHHDRQLSSNCHCATIPSFERAHHEPVIESNQSIKNQTTLRLSCKNNFPTECRLHCRILLVKLFQN